jgi:hypothetical protein
MPYGKISTRLAVLCILCVGEFIWFMMTMVYVMDVMAKFLGNDHIGDLIDGLHPLATFIRDIWGPLNFTCGKKPV